MNAEKKAANALGAKTARACDSCLRKRARWFCAADDAFLCQACDASVHSANPLAQRHERLRLKTASLKPGGGSGSGENNVVEPLPAWHQGFRRKARTPRHSKATTTNELQVPKIEPMPNPLLVPELGSDEPSLDENEEQLLYRVPIFDPEVAEFCTSSVAETASNGVTAAAATAAAFVQELKPVISPDYVEATAAAVDALPGFLPSDVDLAEFAADVESLLGTGIDQDSFCMQGLGLLESKEEEDMDCCFEKKGRVKVEEEEEDEDTVGYAVCHVDAELDLSRDTLDLNFDYASTGEEEEEEVKVGAMNRYRSTEEEESKRISLTLNYDAVITAWASQGSPWTTGDRPHINPDDCWPDCMGTCFPDLRQYGGDAGVGGQVTVGDGGREARVSRYREKRRTRLFSKKIRYEVRKLNAEKRPRMKGRFVKRASFAGPAFPF
ncbi:zinc finger protein CONSTANS-LIKE 16 [Magnolia sinica]|uniref:zinc finger protein CONSTANS-LIKE 16 n=1 Tax=Magnolia sinica TaxID=86752 RepID=UPI0026598DE3|nr:zinc finger protein CONSTANS-LIKE 16 [Magnolia sinica]